MLVLSRKVNEGLLFDDGRIRVVIMKIQGRRVQVGIEASAEVNVLREELMASGNETKGGKGPARDSSLGVSLPELASVR